MSSKAHKRLKVGKPLWLQAGKGASISRQMHILKTDCSRMMTDRRPVSRNRHYHRFLLIKEQFGELQPRLHVDEPLSRASWLHASLIVYSCSLRRSTLRWSRHIRVGSPCRSLQSATGWPSPSRAWASPALMGQSTWHTCWTGTDVNHVQELDSATQCLKHLCCPTWPHILHEWPERLDSLISQ